MFITLFISHHSKQNNFYLQHVLFSFFIQKVCQSPFHHFIFINLFVLIIILISIIILILISILIFVLPLCSLFMFTIILHYFCVHACTYFCYFYAMKKPFFSDMTADPVLIFFLHYFFNFFFIIFYVFFYCFFQLFLHFLLIVKNLIEKKERECCTVENNFNCEIDFFFDFKISLKLKKLEIKKNLFYFYQKWLCTYFTV